ncbi:MAG TPA: hypothetical protein VGA73_02955 [Candidatus Binatia bacterium]
MNGVAGYSNRNRLFFVLVSLIGITTPAFAAQAKEPDRCEFKSASGESYSWHWNYPVGAKLTGTSALDLDGDGRPEQLQIMAEVQRDHAFDLLTKQRSKETYCWFRTRLEIRSPERDLLYQEEWSTKYEDMAGLLETHGASSPDDYFARFGRHNGFFTSGMTVLHDKTPEVWRRAVAWSLSAQGLKSKGPESVVAELSRLKTLRALLYRAEWRENLRVVTYIPSLRRAVAIQVGY